MVDERNAHPVHRRDGDGTDGLDDATAVESSLSAEEENAEEALEAVEERTGGSSRPPRRVMREMLAMFGQVGPPPNPLAEKITADHITTMLSIDLERVKGQREDDREHRRGVLFLCCAFLVFVLVTLGMLLWAGNDDLTEKVLIGLVTAVASGLGGYGLGKAQNKV
jgi:hypothetical protein